MNSNQRKSVIFLFVSVLLILALGACGGENASPVPVENLLTDSVGTIAASIIQTQTALAPTITVTSTVTNTATATFTNIPYVPPTLTLTPTYAYYTLTPTLSGTYTPSPTGTLATSTVNPSTLAYGCNNLAFVRDVTLPSGTVVQAGDNIVKTWKVANNGTCNWLYQYTLELLSANYPVSGTSKLGKVVTVNDWAEVSINLDVPKNPGTYTSYWRLSDGAGHMFGSTLTASFKIEAPTKEPPTATNTPSPTPTYTPDVSVPAGP